MNNIKGIRYKKNFIRQTLYFIKTSKLSTKSYKLPTMYFQKSLPRLPIPSLHKSCERFLAAVQPLLNAEEYLKTQEIVTEFLNNEGLKLQQLLKTKDAGNKRTSYISEPWFDMYLRDRSSLPLNYNPLIVMKPDNRPEYQSQLVRATNLIISSLKFWKALQNGTLEPEIFHLNPKKSDTAAFRKWIRLTPKLFATYAAYVFKAFPLDMTQYEKLFGVSRIPGNDIDTLVQHKNSNHILVMNKGNMFAINVFDNNGNIVEPYLILKRLKYISQFDSKLISPTIPLGLLTTNERNIWAKSRNHLKNGISEINKKLLEDEVDGALFCLCLDDHTDPVCNENNPEALIKHLLAGHAKNRWFDKSISLIISADGTSAINFEHSWGDGVAVLRYINEIFDDSTKNPSVNFSLLQSIGDEHLESVDVRKIDFVLDDKIKNDILDSSKKHSEKIKNLSIDILRYPFISKQICKRFGVSPDSIMQLSFQLAYLKAFNNYVGTYESCSTAAFCHGRTETIRPCTMATKMFCESIAKSSTLSNINLTNMLYDCSAMHSQLTKDCAMGQGFDRHLFALKHLAIENNIEIPKLYSSYAYHKINKCVISTSTLSSQAIMFGAFGPVVPEGFGIGYSINDNDCGAIISSYGESRGQLFSEHLNEAMDDISRILLK